MYVHGITQEVGYPIFAHYGSEPLWIWHQLGQDQCFVFTHYTQSHTPSFSM